MESSDLAFTAFSASTGLGETLHMWKDFVLFFLKLLFSHPASTTQNSSPGNSCCGSSQESNDEYLLLSACLDSQILVYIDLFGKIKP